MPFGEDADRVAEFNQRLDKLRVDMVKAVRTDLSHGRPTDEEIDREVNAHLMTFRILGSQPTSAFRRAGSEKT